MSELLNRLGYLQTRRDRTANLDLARVLVANGDSEGIQEIARNLWNENRNIHDDCMVVMYEIGKIEPNLINPYATDFIKLLNSEYQKMVEGAITALAEVAKVNPGFIFKHLKQIQKIANSGVEERVEKAISTLSNTVAASQEYKQIILPWLMQYLSNCPRKQLCTHAETIFVAVDSSTKSEFIKILKKHLDSMSASEFTRLKRIIRMAENL